MKRKKDPAVLLDDLIVTCLREAGIEPDPDQIEKFRAVFIDLARDMKRLPRCLFE
jgi:hypothetical protein